MAEKLVQVGQTIIVKEWGSFPEMRMTCVNISYDAKYCLPRYEFDNGMELSDFELQGNFDLWESRNGFDIVDEQKRKVFQYDVLFKEGVATWLVFTCYTTRTAEEVAEWFTIHFGAENPQVTISDNPKATSAMVVRI